MTCGAGRTVIVEDPPGIGSSAPLDATYRALTWAGGRSEALLCGFAAAVRFV
jgi:hypothetical protein